KMTAEQVILLLRTQFTIIGNAFVLATRDQVKKVFFEVRTRTGNGVHFILPDHFRERNAQFGSAHRPGERDHHFPAMMQMRDVRVRRIYQDCGVEVTEMPINELADAAHLHFINSSSLCFLDLMQNLYRDSQALITLFLPKILMARRREFVPPGYLAL